MNNQGSGENIVSFDGRVHFYQEVYKNIEGFNSAYRENKWHRALGYLESWQGLVFSFITKKSKYSDVPLYWHRWNVRLLALLNFIEATWDWDDYEERWKTRRHSVKTEFVDPFNNENLTLSRNQTVLEIRKCLMQLNKALVVMMHEEKMLLPEKQIMESGSELRNTRYG